MTEMRFILHARGQLLRGVKLYDLGTKAELYFDSITGLRPAKIVGVHDKEPEVLEDGSLAPWTMLAVQVNWGGTLGWKDELIKAERIVPASCLYGEYKNKITPFRWRSPMSTLPPVGTRVRALTDIHDDASDRRVPQHAKVGDEGIIEGYDGDEVPTVNWGKGTGFGVYDTPLDQLEVV